MIVFFALTAHADPLWRPAEEVVVPAVGTRPVTVHLRADAGTDPLTLAAGLAATEAQWRAAAATTPDGDGAVLEGPLGVLPMGDARCDLVAVAGAWAWDGGCRVRYPAEIQLFPWRTGGVTTDLVSIEIPALPEPPTAVVPRSPPWGWFVAGATSLTVPLAGAIGFLIGRRVNAGERTARAVRPTSRSKPPEAPKSAGGLSAASRSLPPKLDPYIARQVALLDHRLVREAAEFLAQSDWIERHRKASAMLLATSDELWRRGQDLPNGYREAWKTLADDVRIREEPVARVAKSLKNVLADRAVVEAMPFESRVAWRALMPYTDVTVTDEGKALSRQLFADVARALISPYIALGQFITEALHRETDLPKVEIDIKEHAFDFAEALGFRYEHVELYHRTDADFMLDRDVTVTGVLPEDVWFGLKPVWPDAGTVLRVQRPCLRGRNDSRTLRGHVVVFRDPNPPAEPM